MLPKIPAAATTDANGLPWRLERMKKAKGPYYILSRGPRDNRESIALGYLSDGDAEAAHAGIQWLRESGTATGAYPTPDRLVQYLRDAPALTGSRVPEHDAKAQARETVVDLLTQIGGFVLEAQQLGDTLDGAALAALIPGLVVSASSLPVDYAAMTLRQYLEKDWEPQRKRTNPSTWAKESSLWNLYILPAMGGLRLRELDGLDPDGRQNRAAHVHFDRVVQNATLKNGEPASGNTKRLIRAAYQACMTHAQRNGHIGKVHDFFAIRGSTERVRPEVEPLTSGEIRKLLDAAEATAGRGGDPDGGHMHRCLFAVTLAQGLRPSEAQRLDWSHVDLDKSRLHVPGGKTKRSKATIPLFPLAAAELSAWWIACKKPQEGPVFVWRGAPLTSSSSFKHALATAARKAGIARRITPYVLRHTFATRSLETGATREEVAAVMRHTNPRMVEEHYDHSDTARSIDATAFEAWQRV